MQVSCPHCSRVLEFSGDRPVFCAYCGQPLESDPQLMATAAFVPPPTPIPGRFGLGGGLGGGGAGDSGGGSDDETYAEVGVRRGPRREEADPEHVAGYKIVKLLGRGGMGSVYEAEDSAFGRRVALKLIGADHVSSVESVERFRQEGRLASTISHPRCVFVLAADEHEGRPYIVMELMPGETLQALVERRGPLPVDEAIAKILDVIDGLREAHLLGVIHRDVKPSNCFLTHDGRVKVGDFGLSKSLDGDAGLTRTGSFVGTPLYASPEQIKRDAVDGQTDVYSASATLYFLLAARPPFQAGDAAAALAKIVSESPTPLRETRPGLPPGLESAVLRGMERDRDRRWADLDRFRRALLPFVSTSLTLTDLTLRVSALFADVLLLLLGVAVFVAVYARPHRAVDVFTILGESALAMIVVKRLAFLTYFAVTDGVFGASLGKRLTGLRVNRVGPGGPPGLWRGLVRVGVFYALTSLPADLAVQGLFMSLPPKQALLYEPLTLVLSGLGCLVMAASMRPGNGFRGLHEFASGTRVVRLPRSGRRRVQRGRKLSVRPARLAGAEAAAPPGVLRSFGPFRVRGAVRWDGDRRVLLAEDPGLNRPVWIVLRPKGSPPPGQARLDLGRPGRPRWLHGGEQGDYRWAASAPQLGCPLADLAGPAGLPWADARPILHELAEELAHAGADGTLPDALSVDQVWVQPDGAVQLVDPVSATPRPGDAAKSDAERSLDFLARVAALALEGGRRRGTSAARPAAIHAAVPAHAGRVLDRLIGKPRGADAPYADVAAFVADMDADRDKPTEVDAARRAAHLGPTVAASLLWLAPLLYVTRPDGPQHAEPWWAVAGLLIAAVAWSALTKGGALLGLTGLALVRGDGRPAERWRCAWRTLLVFAPVAAALAGCCWADSRTPPRPSAAWAFWGAAVAVLASYPVLALASPAKSLHDRLAGTTVVPK